MGRTTQGSPRHSTTVSVRCCGGGDLRRLRLMSDVNAEPARRLPPQVSSSDEMLEERCWRVVRLTELQIQHALDRERNVEANHVEQLERPHRVATADLHGVVDVVRGGVVRLKHLDGVVEVREQERVDDESRAVK